MKKLAIICILALLLIPTVSALEVVDRTTQHSQRGYLTSQDITINKWLGQMWQQNLINAHFDCSRKYDMNGNGQIETFPWYSECVIVLDQVHNTRR